MNKHVEAKSLQHRVIAITGRSQSGKDTLGAYLAEKYGFATYAFAKRLKEAAYALNPIVEIDKSSLRYTRLQELVDNVGWDKAKEIPEVGRTLQRVGTEAGWQIHGARLWVNLAEDDYLAEQPLTTGIAITDLRFPSEEEWLRERGGVLIRVERPVKARNSTRDQNHISEKLQDTLTPDFTIVNDGTLTQFHEKIEAVYAQIA